MKMPTALAPKTEFRFSYHAAFGQIDAEKGKLADVSLMTEGEALGHGVWCDQKTLQSVFALAQKSPVKAYLTHGDFFQPDRLGDEVGLFSGLYIEGNQLKAKQFTFFKSFITSEKQKYEALMELAQADASLFGVSLSFSGRLVWVMSDGSEIPCGDDDEIPEGAMNAMPSVRVTRIYSADFVSDPAANPNGLFDARLQAAAKLLGIPLPSLSSPSPLKEKGAETPAKPLDGAPNNETKNTFTMIKDIRAKFSDPVKFARACELLSENEKITLSEIESKIAGEAEASRVKAIETELAALKTELAAEKAKVVQLETEKAAASKGATPIDLGVQGGGDESAKLVAEWAKLSGKEATQFWNKHEKALLAFRASHPQSGVPQ